MKQSALNNFNKGMTRDLGKTVPQVSTYLEGRNIRIIANEDSLESGIVVNVDGNAFSFKLETNCPPLSACYEAWDDQENSWNVYDGSLVPQSNVYVHHITTGAIYFYTGEVLGEFDHTRYEECGPMPTEEEIAASLGLCTYDAIGWTTIRDTLYIFATDNASINPGGVDVDIEESPVSFGCIFKIEFNSQSNAASSVEVVYSHPELNFTKRHQIEAIGRYESKNVQRLYWTDNFNTVRTINVKDPDIEALTPEDLDINPSVIFSTPEVIGMISSGELPAGMYQYAYRLKNSSGAETRFSPFTNFLHVVQASEGSTPYWGYSEDPENITEYSGSNPGEMCSKSVRLKISGLDLDYDVIEVAAIYKSTNEGVSSSYIFARQTISSETTEVLHSTSTSIIGLISLTELTTFNYNIRKAKTLETKDNRLFLGNVITPLQELPFDAKAPRYKRNDEAWNVTPLAPQGDTTTYIDEDFDETAEYTTGSAPYPAEFENTLEENLNSINPYNELRAINLAGKRYVYQKDGFTLGGEGANVSYTFIKKVISGDNFVGGAPATSPPYIDVHADAASCATGTDWIDYKNPAMAEGYKGYQRDEVYRFGVVLHDLQGNPGFVNWVGDIRFPSYYDFDHTGGGDLYNYTLSQTRSTTQTTTGGLDNVGYALTGSHSGAELHIDMNTGLVGNMADGSTALSHLGAGYGKNIEIDRHEMYALGIQFNVVIPDHLKPLTSGYSIVRVERKEIDKTVLGIGMGSWMYRFSDKQSDDMNSTFQVAHSAYMNTWQYGAGNDAEQSEDYGELRHTLMNMDSPDFVLTGKYPTAGDCDWVQVVGVLNTGSSRNAWENDFKFEGADTGTDDDFYRKMYAHQIVRRGGTTSADTIQHLFMDGGDADGAFFKPMRALKFPSGGSIDGTNDYPMGINNVGIEVNETTSQDVYSVGCDTLFVEFQGYTSIPGFWGGTAVLTENDKIACPYWVHWLLSAGFPGTSPQQLNKIYFNNNTDYDDSVEYFDESDPLDTSMSGSESDSGDRHNNPWKRSKLQEKPLLSWRKERPTQYGGNSYEARSRSVYMSTGVFVPTEISNTDEPLDVWGGDMFIHFYDFQKMRRYQEGQSPDDSFNNTTSGPSKKHSFSFVIPVESTINIGLRTGYHFANKDDFTGKEENGLQLDQYEYDQVYSAEADLTEFYPRAYNYVEADEFDSRVLYSQLKTNGDKVDSWRQFKMNDYRDVDGAYGPINKIVHFSDTIYYLQDRGVGVLSINPVAITTLADQSSIVLGTGDVIQDSRYLSTGVGCKHQWSVLSTNKGLYWLDILTNSIYKINREGTMELSRVKGMKSYFEGVLEGSEFSLLPTGDNPAWHSGVTTGFDSKNNEVLFSFLKREYIPSYTPNTAPELEITLAETLVYSETTGTFTSFYDFASPFLVNMQDKLLSVHPDTQYNVFLHNTGDRGSWYGIVHDSVLKYIVNQFPTETKVFDSFTWHMEGGVWSSIYCTTDHQESLTVAMVDEVNMWRRERTWRTPVPRGKDQTRLRDKYLINTFIYNNDRTPKFRAHYIETKFRVSKR